MCYGRGKTKCWLLQRSSPTLSFCGFFVCVKKHKARRGALWRGPGAETLLGSSARFPNVELWSFLRLCTITQSAPGRAMAGSEHFGFINEVTKRWALVVSSYVYTNTKRTRVRYGRVRTLSNWVHPQDSQTLSFRGFFVCVREHKAKPRCAMAGSEHLIGFIRGIPKR